MKLMILDGNSVANRAFYGVRALTAPDGTPTNAVYGFLSLLHKLLEEHADSILGEYIRSMRKKEPGVCTAKALEYGVNALLGYDC